MKRQAFSFNRFLGMEKNISKITFTLLLITMSCTVLKHDECTVEDIVEETILGSIVSENDTIELKKIMSFTNRDLSTRCTVRLCVINNGSSTGYYYLGGDDYELSMKGDSLICVTKDSKCRTAIDFSHGIPSCIFLLSTYDNESESSARGDYYCYEKLGETNR